MDGYVRRKPNQFNEYFSKANLFLEPEDGVNPENPFLKSASEEKAPSRISFEKNTTASPQSVAS